MCEVIILNNEQKEISTIAELKSQFPNIDFTQYGLADNEKMLDNCFCSMDVAAFLKTMPELNAFYEFGFGWFCRKLTGKRIFTTTEAGEIDCPHCKKTLLLKAGYENPVYCDQCNKTYETLWDYIGSDGVDIWLTGIERDGEFTERIAQIEIMQEAPPCQTIAKAKKVHLPALCNECMEDVQPDNWLQNHGLCNNCAASLNDD